ncbi:hypothetical protein BJV77DRAFT_951016, partial [Russula vinacea]
GPNCSHEVLHGYLASQNQNAATFYIKSIILGGTLEAQCGLAYGHKVCARECFPLLIPFIIGLVEAIKLVTGVTPTRWLPSHGDVDDHIRFIANELGLQTIIWKFDSNDWCVVTDSIMLTAACSSTI